jgi:hypothetical protein
MSVLIIHTKDSTTDFLKPIYAPIPSKTIVYGGVTKTELKELIPNNDRVIMLGHGTPWGLLSVGQFPSVGNYIDDYSRDSLRDLIVIIDAHSKKTYHLGFGKTVTRSNLAKANEKRSSKIFEEFAFYLIDIARKKRANDDFIIKGKVYAFDSSTIDLCLSVFWWAKFRKAKAGIKVGND